MSDEAPRIPAEQVERICADARRIATETAKVQGVPASVVDPGVVLRIVGVLDQAARSIAPASSGAVDG